MNLVIDDAAEVYLKDAKPRRELGLCSNFFTGSVANQTNRTYTLEG